ncbi:4-alpha-glucanotransferase [Treponema pectinovorum]|uniref:4-alpha-glucanotransferase n=1 Tax=Treponema pectinovorum TaxID=164 RepID=UPI0011C7A121|nr:4-alpha-glucanotransferase [Treponema pectinovorum]
MKLSRKSGILLHPTSLPNSYAIGTFGKAAFDFVDYLSRSKIGLWQVLPLGPTGYGDSPYQAFSAFALNPLLIDFENLVERLWATQDEVEIPPHIKKDGNIDFGSTVIWKTEVLKKIAFRIQKKGFSAAKEFEQFCKENDFWLKDYAAFMSIKSHFEDKGIWNKAWSEDLRHHEKNAIREWEKSHAEEIFCIKLTQFFAFTQWNELHEYAKLKDVEIIGDMPIFVSADSADVWANQKFFQLDENSLPKFVAGVPPDYFSPTGQLWGNPLYNWKALAQDGYSWWILRFKQMKDLFDYVRIDHFRGFDSYWAVKYGQKTAEKGRWLKGPGFAFFESVKKSLGDLPLLAEDLGEINDSVRNLLKKTNFPGMKVLQFGFDTAEAQRGALLNSFLPHTYINPNSVAYTGTHDNDTTQGSLNAMSEECLCLVASYVEGREVFKEEAISMRTSGELCRKLVSLCFSTTAVFAIVPLQDLYNFGSDCRMNTPGTSSQNWTWRMRSDMLYGEIAEEKSQWLRTLNMLYARCAIKTDK